MAEVITVAEPVMPRGYEPLSGVEIQKQENGEIRFQGILELGEGDDKIVRKVLLPDLDTIFHDKSLEPANPAVSPEAQAIINELRAQNEALLAQVATLQQQKTALEERLSAYDSRFEQQQAQIDELRAQLEGREKSVDGFLIGDTVARLVDGEGEDQEFESGYVVAGFSEEDEHGLILRDVETNNEVEVQSDQVISESELEETKDKDEENDGTYERPRGNIFDRSRFWLGDMVTGRRAHAAMIRERDGRRVRVIEEDIGPNGYVESDRAAGGRAALMIGAAAVAGALLWELWEHKIYGHSSSREARELAQQFNVRLNAHEKVEKARHLAEMKAIVGQEHLEKVRHAAEMKAIAGEEHLDNVRHTQEMNTIAANHKQEMAYLKNHVHDAIVHAHGHEMLAIHGNEFTNGHPNSYFHPNPNGSSTSDFSGYKYPWDYTHSKSQLRVWADRAARDGHRVRWIVNSQGHEILQIDGSTNTQKVLEVITRYR